MNPAFRALAIYVFLLVIFRITGKRTLGEVTTFDFVLLLIIGEATQQALLGDDFSVTNALLVITVLIAAEVFLATIKQWFPTVDRVMEGRPIVLVRDGKKLEDRMKREHIDDEDILEAARSTQGLARLDQIKYAVLERNGEISIIPR